MFNIDIYYRSGIKKQYSAFLDTGNKLIDPYKKRPIILINKKDVKTLYKDEDLLLVPYDTINGHSLLKCIIPDKIEIIGVGIFKNVLIGISDVNIKMDGVDCILHTKLLEGYSK